MLEMRKGCEQGLDLEMSAGAELTVRAAHSMLAADCGGTPALQIEIFTSQSLLRLLGWLGQRENKSELSELRSVSVR